MPAAVTSEELYEFGGRTELADWVLEDEDLSAHALALYTRICLQAQQAACGGKRLTFDLDWADWASGGNGESALMELLEIRALTKVATYRGGKTRFQTESYPPFIQDLRAGRVSRREIPGLSVA